MEVTTMWAIIAVCITVGICFERFCDMIERCESLMISECGDENENN